MKHVIELDEEQEENLKDYIESTNTRIEKSKGKGATSVLTVEQALSIIIDLGFEELGYI